MEIKQKIRPFRFEDPFEVYRQFAGQPSLLLESNTVNRRYSRNNLIAATQALEIRGRVHSFEINALTGVGERLLSVFSKDDFGYAHDLKISENSIRGNVERHFNPDLPEQERLSQRNISHVIRTVLSKFSD
ncbi:MAG: hypothetical protein KKE20_07180, partial [Nanoarchaeota archaeon]|nr:hypothetical protein [Nanoarchaeota archaeon]